MIAGLEALLADLASRGATMSYGALARELELPGPGSIARLAVALEMLMATDAATGQALRAALVTGRLAGGLPSEGFFLKAGALGFDVSDRSDFVAQQRAVLFGRKY